MENLKSYEEINEGNNSEGSVTFLATVDDYEHSGDTDNEVRKWNALGARTKVIPPEIPEDNPAPMIEVTVRLSNSIADDIIKKAKTSLEKANRTGDYGKAAYAWDVEEIFSEYDKKYGTKFVEEYAGKLKDLEELH